VQIVSEALAAAARREPVMAPYYDLYRTLLESQEKAKGEITATLELADEDALRERVLQGLPSISFNQLPIEPARFAVLAKEIARALVDYDVDVEDRALPADDEWITLARQQFETGQMAEAKTQAGESEQAVATLAHVAADQALRPYLQWAAAQVLPYVDQERWKRGYCPTCGGAPDFATLDGETGTRHLVCSRCDSQWLYRRLGCPFCGTTDHTKVAYYPSKDKVYRLYVCQECRHYLKTIDLREAKHTVFLPVERITSVAMDAAAQQEGYRASSQ
jgi:FdhE protein